MNYLLLYETTIGTLPSVKRLWLAELWPKESCPWYPLSFHTLSLSVSKTCKCDGIYSRGQVTEQWTKLVKKEIILSGPDFQRRYIWEALLSWKTMKQTAMPGRAKGGGAWKDQSVTPECHPAEIRDLSPTAAVNWILPTPWLNLGGDLRWRSPEETTQLRQQGNTWFHLMRPEQRT